MSENVQISKKLVLINSLCTVGTRLINITVLLWVHQYLLRRISAPEYAVYAVVTSIMAFAPLFASVLLGGVSRYIIEAYAQGDRWRITQIVSSMTPLLGAGALLFLAVGWSFAWFIGDIMTVAPDALSDARIMLGLLMFSQSLTLFITPYSVGLYANQKFIWINLIELGAAVLRITILLALLLGVSPRALWLVIAVVSSEITVLTVTTILSRRLIPDLRYVSAARDWALARKLTSFGAWMLLGGLAHRIRTSADALILNELSTSHAVAAFHVGSIPDRQLEVLSRLATNPLQPPLTAMHAKGDVDALKRAYLRGNRYYLWLVMLPAMLLIAFSEPLVQLYLDVGPDDPYMAAANVMLLISAYYPFSYSSAMLYRICLATAQIRKFLITAVGTSLTTVCFTIFLVGPMNLGATGAALSILTVTSISTVLVIWPLGLKMLDLSFARFFRETLLSGMIPTFASLPICVLLATWREPNSWLLLIAYSAIGGCVYLGALLLGALQPADRRDLASLTGYIRGKLGRAQRRSGA